ncbi:MAG TPA: hypothetical protein DDX71_03585 [Ruminococcus sp.]|nr:hypothetical protein [Ruminococcus sp.]
MKALDFMTALTDLDADLLETTEAEPVSRQHGNLLRYAVLGGSAAVCAGILGGVWMLGHPAPEEQPQTADSVQTDLAEETVCETTDPAALTAVQTDSTAVLAAETTTITGRQVTSAETETAATAETNRILNTAETNAVTQISKTTGSTAKATTVTVTLASYRTDPDETTATTAAPTGTTLSYDERMRREYEALLARAITDAPYEDVLHETISMHDVYQVGPIEFNAHRNFVNTISSWNKMTKIELLRRIDDDRMYAIQRSEEGGLLYTFYYQDAMNNTAYMTKSLEMRDFDDVQVGDNIAEVLALEPATSRLQGLAEITSSRHPVLDGFDQYLLLRDGLLHIHYNMEDKNGDWGEWLITSMELHPDFRIEMDYGFETPWVYDFTIRPEDYPA